MKRLLFISASCLLICTAVFILAGVITNEVKQSHDYGDGFPDASGQAVPRHQLPTVNEPKGEAWDALRFFSTSRAFPYKDVPADAYTKAYEQYQTNFESNAMRTNPDNPFVNGGPQWQSIGPNNLGGRTLCMAFDPLDTGIVWLGSASGGLWKSTKGGIGTNAWTYIPTGFPVRGVSCIAINPANHNEMYIGSGETYSYGTTVNGLVVRPTRGIVGIGILKSVDGGLSWAPSLNWSYDQTKGVWDLVMNPLNPQEVYAATTEGIYETMDGGATWNQVFSEKMVMDLEIDPVDTARVYAGVGNVDSQNKGIYRTTNSGASWTRLTAGLPPNTNQGRITLRINPMNHNTIFAVIADLYVTVGIYKSQNKGDNWTVVNNTADIVNYQGWYAKALWVKSNDSTQLMYGGIEVFVGTNGGGNITQKSNQGGGTTVHSDIHDIVGNPLNANKVYILSDGGLYRTNNFGTGFFSAMNGYVTSQYYIGSLSTTDSTLMIGGVQDNYTNKYSGLLNWNIGVIGGDGSFNAINPKDDFTQFGSSQYLNVSRSYNRGATWKTVLSHPSSAFGGNTSAFIAPVVMCNSDTAVLYGAADTLFRSSNGGTTWTKRGTRVDNGNVILTMAVSNTNVDSLYFATAPTDSFPMHVFRSIDGGLTLTDISTGLPNRYPRDIAVNPKNSKEAYIVYSGFGAGHVFKTRNAGQTWTDITGTLPDVPYHTVEILPYGTDTVFVGSDLGVFASLDGGGSWYAFNTGFPDGVMIFDLKYSPSDNALVAFSHGNGVYKTSLNDLITGIPSLQSFTQAFTQKIISNPVHDQLSLLINSDLNANASFSIYDFFGKCVKHIENRPLVMGLNTISADISGLSSGTYFVKTDCERESKVSKFVVMQ